jgi:S-DNA-T family DNA segregation ATPase FtsK/SpoIIIE
MTKRATARRSSRGQRKKSSRPAGLSPTQRDWLIGLFLLAVGLITLLGLFSSAQSTLTSEWLGILRRGVGWGVYAVPICLGITGAAIIARATGYRVAWPWGRLLGGLLVLLVGLVISHAFTDNPADAALTGLGGGSLGYWLSRTLIAFLGRAGALVILLALGATGLLMVLHVSLNDVIIDLGETIQDLRAWWRAWRSPYPVERDMEGGVAKSAFPSTPGTLPETAPASASLSDRLESIRQQILARSSHTVAETPVTTDGPMVHETTMAREGVSWVLPRVDQALVETEETQMSLADIREKTRLIEDTLRSLGVPVTVVEVNPGPVVTQFGLEPGYSERRDRDGRVKRVKVKVSRIAALSNDLALALAASPLRIEAPVPGKAIVGLEIPNDQMSSVGLRGVMESEQFQAVASSRLALALGRDVSGAAVADDLATLPHLLIAGATGSGKSVCINALVSCLLCRNTPDDIKMLMIDPKRVELSNYNGIPHLLAPVVVEVDRVVGVLNWVTHEMDRRYKVFARAGARNLDSYNEKALANGEAKLPLILVFIDELADLMMVAPDEVERSLCRIAQMARATGIHLVVATQRPSVDVVTGLIKANFPARLSFAVTSQIDSRVILDTFGAEKLLGRGDALYMAPDSPKLVRIQGCYVSDAEIGRLVAFWKDQVGRGGAVQPMTGAETPAPSSLVQRAFWPEAEPGSDIEEDTADPLLNEAIALVREEQKASVSFLQRKLRIGYSRAARLVDLLEEKRIVGPATGTSKTRDVLPEEEGSPSVT